MYVLTLKNRLNEFRAVQRLRELGLLDEGLLPLVEVVKKDVAFDKLVNPSTGEYVKVNKPYKSGKRKGQPRMCTVDDLETERDVTLDNISDAFAGKKGVGRLLPLLYAQIQRRRPLKMQACS